MNTISVYVGLGSNLSDPVRQVQTAFESMSQLAAVSAARLSPLYQSAAVGPAGQPDYINAAAHLVTSLPPIELLEALQTIEQKQMRVRGERWGPRTIDLDILLYGTTAITTPRLSVPHPYLKQRSFVLAPLMDLDPALTLPDGTVVANLLAVVGSASIHQLPQIEYGNSDERRD